MSRQQRPTIELPIRGLDCAECAWHVRQAIETLPGVIEVNILLAAQKAIIRFDPAQTGPAEIRGAVEGAGYSVAPSEPGPPAASLFGGFTRRVLALFGVVFGTVLFVVVVGEWFGLFEVATRWVPWPAWAGVILIGGWPIFRNVVRATLKLRIIAHSLMTVGMCAAIAVGKWPSGPVGRCRTSPPWRRRLPE